MISKREKVLIFIAAVTLISCVAFNFIILPLYNGYSEKQERLALLESEKTFMEIKLGGESGYRASLDAAKTAYEDIQLRYPSIMSSTEVDRLLTGLILQNGLTPIMLGISGVSKSKQDGPAPVFSAAHASMNLKGDYNALKRLVSAVNGIEYIKINRMSFGGQGISVQFEITMLNSL